MLQLLIAIVQLNISLTRLLSDVSVVRYYSKQHCQSDQLLHMHNMVSL